MRRSFSIFIIVALAALGCPLALAATPSKAECDSVLTDAREQLMKDRMSDGLWLYPAHLGLQYTSQYRVMLGYYGTRGGKTRLPKTQLQDSRLRELLLASQLPDGSWQAVRDANVSHGDLDTTVFNYWALKAMKENPDSDPMVRARAFIRAGGGLEKTTVFTRVFLALFNNSQWKDIPWIPLAPIATGMVGKLQPFGQWIAPHITPIAYLRHYQVNKVLPPEYRLDELWLGKTPPKRQKTSPLAHLDPSAGMVVKRILREQESNGTWEAYTLATVLNMAVLEHAASLNPSIKERAARATERAMEACENFYFNMGDFSYHGVVDDGRFWDTPLAAIAAADAGQDLKSLEFTGATLSLFQNENGGFGYGFGFEDYPDTDDTAEIMILLSKFGSSYEHTLRKAEKWLLRMQNSDGGWGAFAKNNREIPALQYLLRDFLGSTDLFDESTPDVTGHILEALSLRGHTVKNSKVVRRAVRYLLKNQDRELHAWPGRWGIHYIYGTSAVVVGMLRAGVSIDRPELQKALQWLLSVQNADGGWGESTLAYKRREWAGRGISTPTQTAWALLALIEAGLKDPQLLHHPAVEKGIAYLVSTYQKSGGWSDPSTVGTGHPGVVYMNYPVYPKTWPLKALARWTKARYR